MSSRASDPVTAPHPTNRSVTTRAVIFDLDGVLVWSVPMHWRAFQKTFGGQGKEFTLEDYMDFGIGAPREEVVRRVMGDLPDPALNELMAEKERHVRDYLRDTGIDQIPGSLEFVRTVRSRNLKTAVASASRNPDLILGAIEARPLFDTIVGRAQVVRSKPHPDLFLAAAEALGVSAHECLVVEDSCVGIEAARAAGMRVIALTTTDSQSNLSRAHGIYSGFAEIDLERWVS